MARTLAHVHARVETGEVPDPTGQARRRVGHTGRVQLDGAAEWMKGAPLVTASLSPDDARALAVDLLIAA